MLVFFPILGAWGVVYSCLFGFGRFWCFCVSYFRFSFLDSVRCRMQCSACKNETHKEQNSQYISYIAAILMDVLAARWWRGTVSEGFWSGGLLQLVHRGADSTRPIRLRPHCWCSSFLPFSALPFTWLVVCRPEVCKMFAAKMRASLPRKNFFDVVLQANTVGNAIAKQTGENGHWAALLEVGRLLQDVFHEQNMPIRL